MNSSNIHKVLGIVLLLPLLAWVVTGAVFLIQPGYSNAYEQLSPKVYEIESAEAIALQPSWTGVRLLRTVLGSHLIVKQDGEWQHLDVETLMPREEPSTADSIALLTDAISHNRERYGGEVAFIDGAYVTTTGVELKLNWNTLKISQQGRDTKFINTLYKIHYLQWLGNKQLNKGFGVLGLALLVLLVCYGLVLSVRGLK